MREDGVGAEGGPAAGDIAGGDRADRSEAGRASERKERHLAICVDPSRYRVETSSGGSFFDRLSLAHRGMPELSLDDIDTHIDFLGRRLAMPFLVSCMTGGSLGGKRVNFELAAAAAEAGVAFGLGSFRPLLRDPDRLEDFRVRAILGDLPLLANIGAVVLRDAGAPAVLEIARTLEADSIVIHLNPGQELFQPGGDRDFTGLKDAIARLVEASDLPVIVKETGFGLAPDEVGTLLSSGVAWVDLAGSGGTNWIAVESYRLGAGPLRDAAGGFDDWGWPTALLLAGLSDCGSRSGPGGMKVIASGGLRDGIDVAKSLALGAGLAAMALPLVRAVEAGGRESAAALLAKVATGLRAAMLLSGSRDVAALRRGILRFEPAFEAAARSLAREGRPE